MQTRFYETQKVSPFEDFQQGDIISLEYPPDLDGPRIGVVINADCDLANKKTDGVVAFLPVYVFHEYLEKFWIPDLREAKKSDLRQALEELTDFDQREVDDLIDWLLVGDRKSVLDCIVERCDLKNKEIARLDKALARVSSLANEDAGIACMREFCEIEADPAAYLKKQISGAVSSMKDGDFLLNEIIGREEIGFVVRSRRIFSIDALKCFTSFPEKMIGSVHSEVVAQRIARLTPIYRFKIVHLFSVQFSRVGLPDDLTALNALAVDDIVCSLMGDKK